MKRMSQVFILMFILMMSITAVVNAQINLDPQPIDPRQPQPVATREPESNVIQPNGLDLRAEEPQGGVFADPDCYYDKDGNVEVCGCSSSDGDCLTWLANDCAKAEGTITPGPDTTACWYDEVEPDRVDDLASVGGSGVIEAEPTCTQEGTICTCNNSDGECLVKLVADCQGEGDLWVQGDDVAMCSHPIPGD